MNHHLSRRLNRACSRSRSLHHSLHHSPAVSLASAHHGPRRSLLFNQACSPLASHLYDLVVSHRFNQVTSRLANLRCILAFSLLFNLACAHRCNLHCNHLHSPHHNRRSLPLNQVDNHRRSHHRNHHHTLAVQRDNLAQVLLVRSRCLPPPPT